MSRAKRRARMSLFPFLNILVCVLGALILILLASASLSLGPGKNVRIRIKRADAHTDLRPTYLEWDGSSVTLHPERTRVVADKALENDGENDSAFGKLLDRIEAEQGSRYIIVAVRPSGFHDFAVLREAIIRRKIRIGYEPIDQRWDLSVGADSAERQQ